MMQRARQPLQLSFLATRRQGRVTRAAPHLDQSVVALVIARLGLRGKMHLARELEVSRSCISDWNLRLGGGIPPKHWARLMDLAVARGARLSFEDLRGGRDG